MHRLPFARPASTRVAPARSALARFGPAIAAALALAAAGCSPPTPLLADAAALTEAQRALAARPEFGGRAPLVHGTALFHDDDIEVAVVDPGQAATLDTYRYQDGQWRRVETMAHSCADRSEVPGAQSADLALAQIDFATAATVRANWYARARGLPGALADPKHDRLSGVWFYTRDDSAADDGSARPDGGAAVRGQWATLPIAGADGAAYRIEFAQDGSVRRFERER